MWHHFYENESYIICLQKTISGSYLKQNNSDLVFQTRTIFLKWVSSYLVTWPKGDFQNYELLFFWKEILHLNFKDIVEKMMCQTFNKIQAKSNFGRNVGGQEFALHYGGQSKSYYFFEKCHESAMKYLS